MPELRGDYSKAAADFRVEQDWSAYRPEEHALYRRLGWKEGDFPLAERTCRNILTLPLFPALTRADIVRVVDTLAAILSAHQKP